MHIQVAGVFADTYESFLFVLISIDQSILLFLQHHVTISTMLQSRLAIGSLSLPEKTYDHALYQSMQLFKASLAQ